MSDSAARRDTARAAPTAARATMPRNRDTSRKGKPTKEMKSAGFGKTLQR